MRLVVRHGAAICLFLFALMATVGAEDTAVYNVI